LLENPATRICGSSHDLFKHIFLENGSKGNHFRKFSTLKRSFSENRQILKKKKQAEIFGKHTQLNKQDDNFTIKLCERWKLQEENSHKFSNFEFETERKENKVCRY
jgi:hypothetical protein